MLYEIYKTSLILCIGSNHDPEKFLCNFLLKNGIIVTYIWYEKNKSL